MAASACFSRLLEQHHEASIHQFSSLLPAFSSLFSLFPKVSVIICHRHSHPIFFSKVSFSFGPYKRVRDKYHRQLNWRCLFLSCSLVKSRGITDVRIGKDPVLLVYIQTEGSHSCFQKFTLVSKGPVGKFGDFSIKWLQFRMQSKSPLGLSCLLLLSFPVNYSDLWAQTC